MQEIITIISLISGIISLYFLVYKPMNENSLNVKENAINTRANTDALKEFKSEVKEEIKGMKGSIEEIERKKHESHERIWKHNEDQDKAIENHELRIQIIEREVGVSGNRERN